MTKTAERTANGLSEDAKAKFGKLNLRDENIGVLDQLVREWSVKGKKVFSPNIADRARRVKRLVAALRELDEASREIDFGDGLEFTNACRQDFGSIADKVKLGAAWMYAVNGKAKGGRETSRDAALDLVEEIAAIVGEDLPIAMRPKSLVGMSEEMRKVLGSHFDPSQCALLDAHKAACAAFDEIVEGVFICVALDNGIGQAADHKPALKRFRELRNLD